MAISVDWGARRVVATASILDIVAFKDEIRDLEDNAEGVLHPPVISYKRLDLGGGAFFHAVDFINSYELIFPSAGNYEIIGNIGADIVPVAGVFVDRTKSAAFATVAGGAGDPWSTVIEGGFTAAHIMRLLASAMAGKVSGAAGTTVTFRDLADSKDRIVATVDASGNRTAVTRDAT